MYLEPSPIPTTFLRERLWTRSVGSAGSHCRVSTPKRRVFVAKGTFARIPFYVYAVVDSTDPARVRKFRESQEDDDDRQDRR